MPANESEYYGNLVTLHVTSSLIVVTTLIGIVTFLHNYRKDKAIEIKAGFERANKNIKHVRELAERVNANGRFLREKLKRAQIENEDTARSVDQLPGLLVPVLFVCAVFFTMIAAKLLDATIHHNGCKAAQSGWYCIVSTADVSLLSIFSNIMMLVSAIYVGVVVLLGNRAFRVADNRIRNLTNGLQVLEEYWSDKEKIYNNKI